MFFYEIAVPTLSYDTCSVSFRVPGPQKDSEYGKSVSRRVWEIRSALTLPAGAYMGIATAELSISRLSRHVWPAKPFDFRHHAP